MDIITKLIDKYSLEYHKAEGMLFKNVYTSSTKNNNGEPTGTAIVGMYCKEPKSISAFHKLKHDELWHFYQGDPFKLYLLYPNGKSETIVMGSGEGENLVFLVPKNTWQAGEITEKGNYSLYGCTMAPGYTDDIFTLGKAEELAKQYPDYEDVIKRLNY